MQRTPPLQIAKLWGWVVIVGGLAVFGLALWLVYWVISNDPTGIGPTGLGARLEVAWRSMVIAGGLLTFLTIVWRGEIAMQQADQQRQQLEAMSEQFSHLEAINLSNLLEKGVNLLIVDDRVKFEAGIIIISQIALAKNRSMSDAATNILIRYTQNLQYEGLPNLLKFAKIHLEDVLEKNNLNFRTEDEDNREK